MFTFPILKVNALKILVENRVLNNKKETNKYKKVNSKFLTTYLYVVETLFF